MGKKDGAKKKEEEETLVNNAAPAPKDDNKEEEEEDSPVIKSLKVIDDKYCAAELAMEREVEKLRKQYAERQAPLLQERSKILSEGEDKDAGTPGCPNFWLEAMSNCEQFEEVVHSCDTQVLKFLSDVKSSDVDPDCAKKGCRLEFTFAENPFFTNKVLFAEAHFDYDVATAKPWKEADAIEVKASEIDWKAGKNITVAKKAAEAGGKKGKKKPSKAKEEPCPSFFRVLFTSAKKTDEELPKGLQCVYEEMSGEIDDEDELLEMHLENVGELLGWMHSEFVPYAVRYFTGEACNDDGDSDEEGEEESSVEDSDEESDEPAPKTKGKKSPQTKPKADPKAGAEKTEECKQQ